METVWNAFMPIELRARAPVALAVLHLVRRHVLPLISKCPVYIKSYSFLVHDRSSGVPCLKSDKRAYLHLRFVLGVRHVRGRRLPHNLCTVRALLPKPWTIIRRVRPSFEERRTHLDLDVQARWYLDLIARHAVLDDKALLNKIGQHLHYFANMAQMQVQ